MSHFAVPQCGSSDKRNKEYEENYSPKRFYSSLIQNSNPLVVDIGGHRGESVLFFKDVFPASVVHSIEPDIENYKFLQSVCSLYGDSCIAYNHAIDATTGKKHFYKQSLSHLGGLSPINRESRDSLGYAETAENKQYVVDAISLDDFCSLIGVDKIDLLKIDVQGCEIAVLLGGRKIMRQVNVCQVEVSFYDFYQNASTLLDVELVMKDAGMVLWDIAKISKNPKTLRTDWAELIYRKKEI